MSCDFCQDTGIAGPDSPCLQCVGVPTRDMGFPRHEGYTVFGSRRISCVYCILASEADHKTSASDPRNIAVGRRMVALESTSTFGFQGNRWLGDTLAVHLDAGELAAIAEAKVKAEAREYAEAKIPEHLLYVKGWPTCIPTEAEAKLLAAVRFAVSDAIGLRPTFIKASEIIARYEQLMAMKARPRRMPFAGPPRPPSSSTRARLR